MRGGCEGGVKGVMNSVRKRGKRKRREKEETERKGGYRERGGGGGLLREGERPRGSLGDRLVIERRGEGPWTTKREPESEETAIRAVVRTTRRTRKTDERRREEETEATEEGGRRGLGEVGLDDAVTVNGSNLVAVSVLVIL